MNCRELFVAGGICLCVAGGTLAQTVGDKTIVTYGPWAKPVNEPKVAVFDSDRMVVLWNIQNVPDLGQVESRDSVAYTTWDPVLNEWRDWRTNVPNTLLPVPFGSAFEASPFVTTVTNEDVFIAGAVAFIGGEQNTFTVHMEQGSNLFDPISLFHFDECDVDYPEIGFGQVGTPSRLTLLQRVRFGGGNCGVNDQIGLLASPDQGLEWSLFEPMTIDGGADILGIPSPPRVVGLPPFQPDMYWSYSTINGEYVRAARDRVGMGGTNDPQDLGLDETRNLSAGLGETYFEAANDEVAGQFQIGPFTSLATTPTGGSTLVAYADIDPESGPDGDFNIYVVADEGGTWSAPVQVNGGPSNGGRYDQFMPRMIAETSGGGVAPLGVRYHVVWYDTRNDPQSRNSENVKLSLYYAFGPDGINWTEIELDEVAIDTQYLDNPNFIGDHIDLKAIPGSGGGGPRDIMVVYMGTRHPTAGGGFAGGGAGGGYSNSGAGGGGSNNFSPDPPRTPTKRSSRLL